MVNIPENYYDNLNLVVGYCYPTYRRDQCIDTSTRWRKYFGNKRWGAGKNLLADAQAVKTHNVTLTNRIVLVDFPIQHDLQDAVPAPPPEVEQPMVDGPHFNVGHYSHLTIGGIYLSKRIDKSALAAHYRRYLGDGQWSISQITKEDCALADAPFTSNRWRCYPVAGDDQFPDIWIKEALVKAYVKPKPGPVYTPPPVKPLRFINRKSA